MHELDILVECYEKKEQAKWERVRWHAFLMMQMHPYIKPHRKKNSPEEWIRFGWEKDNVQDAIDTGRWRITDEEKKMLESLTSSLEEE